MRLVNIPTYQGGELHWWVKWAREQVGAEFTGLNF
jgi:hypothetical protein